jgi:hypothetical protein
MVWLLVAVQVPVDLLRHGRVGSESALPVLYWFLLGRTVVVVLLFTLLMDVRIIRRCRVVQRLKSILTPDRQGMRFVIKTIEVGCHFGCDHCLSLCTWVIVYVHSRGMGYSLCNLSRAQSLFEVVLREAIHCWVIHIQELTELPS